MDDEAFWEGFCRSSLSAAQFNHRGHVRAAYLHLQRFKFDEAHLRMRAGIIRLNSALGGPETAESGYHETLTRLWLSLVANAREADPDIDSNTFCERHPELLDKASAASFYSPELIKSLRARCVFVPPDLTPLPGTAPAPVARRGLVHHVDLSVADPWASRPFYQRVLGFLGYRMAREDARGFDFERHGADGSFCSLGLMRAQGPAASRGHDRYAPGLHHLAFQAESREAVISLHALLCEMGATVLDAPAEYPAYGAGYFAVFFSDPDGLKLEVVHAP